MIGLFIKKHEMDSLLYASDVILEVEDRLCHKKAIRMFVHKKCAEYGIEYIEDELVQLIEKCRKENYVIGKVDNPFEK